MLRNKEKSDRLNINSIELSKISKNIKEKIMQSKIKKNLSFKS